MTPYDIYSRDDCESCQKAKALLTERQLPFVEHVVGDGKDITKLELADMFPEARFLPIILKDGQMIGGFENLVDHLTKTE